MKILITESRDFSAKAVKELEMAGNTVDQKQCDYNILLSCVHNYDGLIVRLGIKVDNDIIERAERLKFIASTTTGLDHIDVEKATSAAIEVISLKGETQFLEEITPTAEVTWGLILMLARKMAGAYSSVLSGAWDRDSFMGESLNGKTLGVVGLGRLGRMVAKIGESFRMKVIYFDPYTAASSYAKAGSLLELASQSDIVSLHVPLNEETRGMVGEETLRAMKKSAYLINTSRGAVIDEEALLRVLEEKLIKGAGLDVLKDELNGNKESARLIDYAKSHDNLIVTPHIGGAATDARHAVEEFIADKVVMYCRQGVRV